MITQFSISENRGIEKLRVDDLNVYSIGISTGGIAELRMASLPSRYITATTVDENGLQYAEKNVADAGLTKQIKLKLEDVASELPYSDNYFDFIYARLVLHYLPKDELNLALLSLHRILKPGGLFFGVVRSSTCEHAHMADSTYDPVTELTEYTEIDNEGKTIRLRRHFFSEDAFAAYVKSAGFAVSSTTSYDEHLYKDFRRTVPDRRTDNLVELLATK